MQITFDYPSEFLISLSGEYHHDNKLAAIVFGTNKRNYGPFGVTDAYRREIFVPKLSKFSYGFGHKSCLAGFYGSVYNGCVTSIGVYVKLIESHEELKTKDDQVN